MHMHVMQININLLNKWFKLWGKTNYNAGFRFRLYLLLLLSFSCVVLDAVGGFVEKSSFVLVVNTKSLVEVDLLE